MVENIFSPRAINEMNDGFLAFDWTKIIELTNVASSTSLPPIQLQVQDHS